MLHIQILTSFLCRGVSIFYSSPLYAAIPDTTVSELTMPIFSVVRFSDESITSATHHGFIDVKGSSEISSNHIINLLSPAVALTSRIAKVDITGLALPLSIK